MPGEASCQINSFFLEYVISQETEENIFLPLEISVLKGEADQNLRHARQHLVIGSTWRRDEFVFAHLDFSRLRSLTVAREWRSFLISDRMKVLRILDLEDTNVTNEDIEQVVKILPRLKFLGLRRCIKALHTLGVVNVGIRGGIDRLRELKNLNQLNKLAVSGIKRKNFKELVSAIEGNSSLESLTLQLHKDNNFECEVKVLEIASRSNLHIKFFGTEMAALEMLKVHCLNGSSLQFYGIEHPRSLKHVLLRGSFDDAVKEELKRKVAQHRKKPLCKVDGPCQP
ncbi:hypothetical protein HU200_013314 [Digitaria exilis]|uniref:Uncharacterized protein n=1 Tax=Digitaria exilis TaxID=1010633 RepID=A0A835FES9_9POAL|nr:hypothetical protein HU200_013314 [Digitaria exilis]